MKNRLAILFLAAIIFFGGCILDAPREEPLPFVTEQDIWEEFGIKVIGEIWEKPTAPPGNKIGEYQLTPDELLLINNVLFSLPRGLLYGLEGITVVYQPMLGSGGFYYSQENRVFIIGNPDRAGSSYTARVKFIMDLYHEIGHHLDYYSHLSPQDLVDFFQLYDRSSNENDFASIYGMSSLAEDFGTLFEAYVINTEALLKQADESPILKAKVELVSKVFSEYRYRVENNGAIMRSKGDERIVWPYKSRTNPALDKKLFARLSN